MSAQRCRTVVLTIASALGCALAPRRLHAQATPLAGADASVIVVECRIGDVAAMVMEARARGDTIFLPTAPLLALAGLDSLGRTGERSLEAASTLLRASVSYDSAALVVQFADSGTLPVSRRATRSRMRALLRERAIADRVVAAPARISLLPPAVTVSYSAQRDGSAAIDAVSRALGGVVEGALTRAPGGGVRARFGWTRIASDSGRGAHVRIGALDELSGAMGVLITNAPLAREDTLRVVSTIPTPAPGTEVELFEDDVLVASDSVADVSPLRLRRAQRYGTHVVRLVEYDTAGGERERRWVESVPAALLPRGALRYAAAVGRCARWPCAGVMGRVAYGLSDRITVSTAATPPARDSPRPPVLRGAVDVRLAGAAVLSVQRAGVGGTSAELLFERGMGRSYVLRSGAAGALPPSPLLSIRTDSRSRLTSAVGSWTLPSRVALDIAGAFTYSAAAVGSSVSVPVRAGVVQGSVAASRDPAGACVGWAVGALVSGVWLARALAPLRSALLRLRDEQRASVCGASSRSVMVALPIGPLSALELSATWSRSHRAMRPVLSVALRRRIGSVALAHAELSGSDGSYVARSDVGGTVVLDRLQRRISFGVDATNAAATVEGLVYVDDNANGRRDAGEELVIGAVVRAGDASAVSDPRGVYALTGTTPDRFVRLAVDSVSVEDAALVPAAPVRVLLTARSVVRVDLALRRRQRSAP